MSGHTQPAAKEPPPERIPYVVAGGTDHSGGYLPDNIRVDRPNDPTSRWSAAGQSAGLKQWLLLEMDTTCIFSKQHTFISLRMVAKLRCERTCFTFVRYAL